jgi:O-antigen chain-terminating methyltransferase
MRYVYDHREEALKTGQTAREYIQKYFSPIAVSQIYQERLNQITNNSRIRNVSSVVENKIGDNGEYNNKMQEVEEKIRTIDVSKISVQSRKPVIGFVVANYKRFIRKSTFWLLDPLISRIRESSIFMLKLQKALDKKIDSMEKVQEDLLGKISQHVQKFGDIESKQKLQYDDLQCMKSEIEHGMNKNMQEMLDANRAELEEARVAIEAEKNALQQEAIILKQGMQKLSQTTDNLMHLVKDYHSESAFLRAKMAYTLQEIRTGKFIVKNADINDVVKTNAIDETFSNTTWLYHAFEQQFRGTETMIKENQRLYIPDIQKSFEVCGGSVLDIGSGRGEFLELCLQANIPAIGVDLNETMIESCRAKGLEVEKADGLAYMESIPDESLCALTAFQVVEHLEPDQIWQFIQIALLKLRPGGVIIMETVNPDSLYALKNFYLDLSHKRPIVSLTLKFLLEAAGFKDVEARFSAPVPKEMQLKGEDSDTQKVNSLLFGNQDYSVLGWR